MDQAPVDWLSVKKVTWWEGTKGKLSGKFAWVRVWPAQDWQRGSAPPPIRSGC